MRDRRVVLITITAVLLSVGLIFIYSTGSIQAIRLGRPEYYFFHKQFIGAVVGFVALIVAYHIPLETYRKFVMPLFVLTLIMLIAVFFQRPVNGAHRWLFFPGFSFQPSELAKFTAILYLAHYLDKKEERMGDFVNGFLPASLLLGVLAAIILLEPDFGTTFLLVSVAFSMYFIGGARAAHLFSVIGFVTPIFTAALLFGYRRGRLLSFLDPWADQFGKGYQLIQSLAAVGSGGIFGKGLGNSSQKLFFLPESHTDFIYAIIAEELGIIGAVAVLVLVVLFFRTAAGVAMAQTDRFKKLLVLGISLLLFIQSFIHIFVVIGLFPTKGITLPFVSYGGSAIVFTLFSVGIILRAQEEATCG